jgi:hypothetical protein
LIALAVSCGGSEDAGELGPSSVDGHSFTVSKIEGNRWAQTGNYLYDVWYTVRNDSSVDTSYSLRDFVVYGPAGDTMTGYTSFDVGRAVSVPAHGTWSRFVSITGSDPGQPWAEKLRVRMNFFSTKDDGVLAGEGAVVHGPQSARLHDFSMTPPGSEPGSAQTLTIPVGSQVTVRWNVENATIVTLESSLGMPPFGGQRFSEQVEPLGSRTFTTQRTGVAWADLDADRGLIHKSLVINVQ